MTKMLPLQPTPLFLTILIFTHQAICPSIYALDFLYNSFSPTAVPLLNLTDDARLVPPVIRLTNDSNQFSLGRAFYPTRIPFNFTKTPNSTISTSFSTQFIFSILPEISTSPGFGLAFVLSGSTSPPNALAGQYFGLFSTALNAPPGPLIVVEFDTGRNTEFNDRDDNHVGIDLNSIESRVSQPAGYFDRNGGFVPFRMRNGENIRAWIEFDGPKNEINVTLAPVGVPRPVRPLINFRDPVIADYLSDEMFVGFSASKTTWVEAQRVLAWSFSDTGVARDVNTTNLPVFLLENASSRLSGGAIAGIVIACVVVLGVGLGGFYRFCWKRSREDDDEIEDWELEYWPHRFSYLELHQATDGFAKDEFLGSGGFGKVYKGNLENNVEVAVKSVNHDSKQGLKEFMAEISSMGRLQHKNLVSMRGWCRKGNVLMLVYDYMPNGSLNKWIFDNPKTLMGWEGRRRVLADVAEGLNYLHHGWEQVVIHRDIKASNVLLDSEMRGRLGDFGLAKLYAHGEAPNTTRVVGTFGYLAPEVVTMASPTAASDVYSFGVVVLEVACGRKPIDTSVETEDEEVLLDWVRKKYAEGKLVEAADKRITGQFEVEEMEAVLKIGLTCCHPDPLRRPNMKEVVAVLLGENVATTPKALLSELTTKKIDIDDGYGDEGKLKGIAITS
ncbi:L-type lectin-domain containing receptor kinase S.1 [Coffea eugenioides]|uniref:L-type lectin-domain containing receptor kinase S.1 n=1 Tax=Coffea eugenioides TaxID=49369 RepID=UPI000F60718D|nr:L-type lectin-domain containing receptor kinase S.1 [Coffea eugenioides]